MQCYTRQSGLPRHKSAYDYRPVPPEYHALRARVMPRMNPEFNGRPGCPGSQPHRPFVDRPESLYNPQYEHHRESRMTEMLDSINRINWTTSQNVCIYKGPKVWPEKGTLSKTFPNSVNRLTYKKWDEYKKLDSCKPEDTCARGTMPYPAQYNVPEYIPAKHHPYVYDMSCVADEVTQQCRNEPPPAVCSVTSRNPKRLKWPLNGPLPKIEDKRTPTPKLYVPNVLF